MKAFNLAKEALAALMIVLVSMNGAQGQIKQTRAQNQLWIGYMTSTVLSEKYAVWNDFHYVPDGFFIARTGLTRQFSGVSATAGYAFALLPVSVENTDLQRREHRPWAQIQFSLPLNKKTSFTQRIRYEARFREVINNGEILNDYVFVNRVRFLASFKRTIGNTEGRSHIPYMSIADEVLLNFGEHAYNVFDQNRISIAVGIQQKNTQYQVGLMNRYVQLAPGKYVLNHTLAFWVTQRLELNKWLDHHHVPENDGE